MVWEVVLEEVVWVSGLGREERGGGTNRHTDAIGGLGVGRDPFLVRFEASSKRLARGQDLTPGP